MKMKSEHQSAWKLADEESDIEASSNRRQQREKRENVAEKRRRLKWQPGENRRQRRNWRSWRKSKKGKRTIRKRRENLAIPPVKRAAWRRNWKSRGKESEEEISEEIMKTWQPWKYSAENLKMAEQYLQNIVAYESRNTYLIWQLAASKQRKPKKSSIWRKPEKRRKLKASENWRNVAAWRHTKKPKIESGENGAESSENDNAVKNWNQLASRKHRNSVAKKANGGRKKSRWRRIVSKKTRNQRRKRAGEIGWRSAWRKEIRLTCRTAESLALSQSAAVKKPAENRKWSGSAKRRKTAKKHLSAGVSGGMNRRNNGWNIRLATENVKHQAAVILAEMARKQSWRSGGGENNDLKMQQRKTIRPWRKRQPAAWKQRNLVAWRKSKRKKMKWRKRGSAAVSISSS